jgi:hypothetical protein
MSNQPITDWVYNVTDLIFEDATDLNLALGQAITTGGGYEQWAILGGFSRLNYSFKDRYLVEVKRSL